MSAHQDADPVVAVAIEYELATLRALDALVRSDEREQRVACLCWVHAVAALNTLSVKQRNRIIVRVVERGRVPEGAWDVIEAALDKFAVAGDRRVIN